MLSSLHAVLPLSVRLCRSLLCPPDTVKGVREQTPDTVRGDREQTPDTVKGDREQTPDTVKGGQGTDAGHSERKHRNRYSKL